MQYKLIRSKRKTLAVTITSGEVVVKAPTSCSNERIEKFVEEKAAWIERKLAQSVKRTQALSPIERGERALIGGLMYDIVRSDAKRIAFDGAVLNMPAKYGDKEAQDKALAAWYKRYAVGALKERLDYISNTIGLKYASFALTNAKGKWGSCDGNCNIRLNWRLVMLEQALVDYVIVHELSHTVHHDHSPAFWAEVGKYFPQYKAARKRLKDFSPLTLFYR